jgi:esterase/lipase superfamily enzyme
MGCYVLQNALKRGPEIRIHSVVFLAADIRRREFTKIVKRLPPDTRVAVFFSADDITLGWLSRLMNLNIRLGFAGPPPELKDRVIPFDCTGSLGAGDAHGKYLSNKGVLARWAHF